MTKIEKRTIPITIPTFKIAGQELAPRMGVETASALEALNRALEAFEVTELSWEDGDKQVRKTRGQSLKLSLVVRIEADIQ